MGILNWYFSIWISCHLLFRKRRVNVGICVCVCVRLIKVLSFLDSKKNSGINQQQAVELGKELCGEYS